MIKLAEVVGIPYGHFAVTDGINIGSRFKTMIFFSEFLKSYSWGDVLLNQLLETEKSKCFYKKGDDYYVSYAADYTLENLSDGFSKLILNCQTSEYDNFNIEHKVADKMLIFIDNFFSFSSSKKIAGRNFDEALLELSEGDIFRLKRDPYKDEAVTYIVLRKNKELYLEQVISSKQIFFS